jgi:hypothetical protein
MRNSNKRRTRRFKNCSTDHTNLFGRIPCLSQQAPPVSHPIPAVARRRDNISRIIQQDMPYSVLPPRTGIQSPRPSAVSPLATISGTLWQGRCCRSFDHQTFRPPCRHRKSLPNGLWIPPTIRRYLQNDLWMPLTMPRTSRLPDPKGVMTASLGPPQRETRAGSHTSRRSFNRPVGVR